MLICANLPSLNARNHNSIVRTQNSVASISDKASEELDALINAQTALPILNFSFTVSDLKGMSNVHTNEVLLVLELSTIERLEQRQDRICVAIELQMSRV